MNKLEKIIGIIAIIALTMKFTLIPGSAILATLSLMILSMLYYPLGFLFFNQIPLKKVFKKEGYNGISALRIIGSIGAGMGLAGIVTGFLFKLQHWPGANMNLRMGFFLTLIILIISLIKYFKNKDVYYIRILKRILIIGIFGLIIYFTPNLILEKIKYGDKPEYIEAYKKYEKNPENEELRINMLKELDRATMTEERFNFRYNDDKE